MSTAFRVWCPERAKGHRADWLSELPNPAGVARLRAAVEAAAAPLVAAGRDPAAPVPVRLGSLHASSCEYRRAQWALTEASRPGKLACPVLASLASARYLIAPTGVIDESEVPAGWGLLDATGHIVRRVKPGAAENAERTVMAVARSATYRLVDGLIEYGAARRRGTGLTVARTREWAQ